MLHITRSFGFWFIVGLTSACGAPSELAPPSGDALFEATAGAPSADAEVSAQIGKQLFELVQSIVTEDESRFRAIASAELLSRIASRGPAADSNRKLSQFLARERYKLNRELTRLQSPASAQATLSVELEALERSADGSTASASVRVNGRLLSKPLYLLREGREYRVNIVAPRSDAAATTSSYRVQNDDPVIRAFSCSGYGGYLIGVHPSQRSLPCLDSCHYWWFDGTTFEALGSFTDCDYNTWGVDMYIRDGYPVCSDPC